MQHPNFLVRHKQMDVCYLLPAGAGKTTLMDVLACRKTAGRMEGEVRVSDTDW